MYQNTRSPRFYASLPGEEIHTHSDLLDLGAEIRIGTIDNDVKDMRSDINSSYNDHIGNYYRPTKHVWNFSGSVGMDYELLFFLTESENHPFVLKAELISDSNLLAVSEVNIPTDYKLMKINVRVPSKNFIIRLSTESMYWRYIDALEIKKITSDNNIRVPVDSVFEIDVNNPY